MARWRISQTPGLSRLKLREPRWPLLEKEWKPSRCGWPRLLNGTDGRTTYYSYQPEAKIRPSCRMAQVCLVGCSPVSGFRKT